MLHTHQSVHQMWRCRLKPFTSLDSESDTNHINFTSRHHGSKKSKDWWLIPAGSGQFWSSMLPPFPLTLSHLTFSLQLFFFPLERDSTKLFNFSAFLFFKTIFSRQLGSLFLSINSILSVLQAPPPLFPSLPYQIFSIFLVPFLGDILLVMYFRPSN